MLERRSVDVCCVQEVRWRGASVRFVEGRRARYKLFWIGNSTGYGRVGIFIAEEWVDKVIDVKRVNDCIIVVKFLIGKRIVTAVSVYTPQCGLSEEEKDKFYDELIAVTSKFGDNELVIVGGDFNGHEGMPSEGYEGVHGGFGFGSRNKEGERLLEFGTATDMVVCNTLFRKRLSRLITYKSGGCQTQIDYILVRKSDRKVVKDVKVVSGEECVSQHRLLVCDIVVKNAKEVKRKYRPRRKVWKLNDEHLVRHFSAAVQKLASNKQCDDSVERTWATLRDSLLEATDETCGGRKGQLDIVRLGGGMMKLTSV